MATGRLASGSIAAGGATQLYRNLTGNSQVITLLASSQVSGKAPKLNVKITNENFTVNTTSTGVTTGTNHTLTNDYLSQTEQLAAPTSYTSASAEDAPAVTTSGSQLHLSIGQKRTKMSMGQAWSKGWAGIGTDSSDTRDHPWGKVSFGGQPACIGGPGGGSYRTSDTNTTQRHIHMPEYPPYYFENPNAFNQNKARGIVADNDSNNMYHIEDISKMDPKTLMKYYNPYGSAGSTLYSHSNPGTNASTYGTVTQRTTPGTYAQRGWIYDIYTGLHWGWNGSGYNSYMWFDEANPGTTSNSNGDSTSNGGVWRWSAGSWTGSDPSSYDSNGRGSVYGRYADAENGLIVTTPGDYSTYIGFKYYDKYFSSGTMMNKGSRAAGQALEAFSRSSYYHTLNYQGSAHWHKLQWVAYHPGNDKYYVCFWDNSGTWNASPVPTMGTSYPTEAGIFEVDVSKIYGKDQSIGNTYSDTFGNALTAGHLTKKGSVPDTVSGLMSKPMRIKDSLWTAHCQNGKMYFSTDLFTWAEQDSDTHFSTDYAMVNASKLGTAGTDETNYFVAASSKSVVYSYSTTVTNDVYDQAAIAGIIAKGAVTPYEQKAIILSDGDAIYVENEDATNAISITAMGVDV